MVSNLFLDMYIELLLWYVLYLSQCALFRVLWSASVKTINFKRICTPAENVTASGRKLYRKPNENE